MLDATTAAAYLAAGTDLARGQAVRDSLGSGTLTVLIRDGVTEKYSGTFTGPLTVGADGDLSAAVRLTGTVSEAGTPSAATWTVKVSNATDRWLDGTLGATGRFQSSAGLVVGQSVRLAFSIAATGTGTVSQTGVVAITLDYAPDISGLQTVSFGMPFPRGVLLDASLIQVETAGGTPVPTDSIEILPWRHLTDTALDGTSIRSVLVTFQHDTASSPSYQVRYGSPRSSSYSSGVTTTNVRDNWRAKAAPLVGEHPQTDNYEIDTTAPQIYEPKVWAALPAAWLMQCALNGPVAAMDSTLLSYFEGYGSTTTNDVAADVTSSDTYPNDTGSGWINWLYEYEAWLFERPVGIYNIYVQTGDVKWLRRFHRASQYYASNITSVDGPSTRKRGTFLKKALGWTGDTGDTKYSLATGMGLDYLLTGDFSLVDKISAVGEVHITQTRCTLPSPATAAIGYTEREVTISLASAITAFEIIGSTTFRERAITVMGGMVSDVTTPPAGYPADMRGVLLHTYLQHEAVQRNGFIMSPWMSGMLMNEVERYYRISGDTDALRMIYDYANFVCSDGWWGDVNSSYAGTAQTKQHTAGLANWLYSGTYGYRPAYIAIDRQSDLLLPFGESGTVVDGNKNAKWISDWSDYSHGYDVYSMLLRGAWAGRVLALTTAEIDAAIDDTKYVGLWIIQRSGTTAGVPRYRLYPTRMFNWWFSQTQSSEWYVAQVA